MFKFSIKLFLVVAAILSIAMFLPKPATSAQSQSAGIFVYGFGFNSWQGRISPWPWAQEYYYPNYFPPSTFQFQDIPVMGNIAGNDTITINCGNGTTATTNAGTQLENVWGQMYYMSSSNLSCTYTTQGTYSPTITVVRTGTSGCGYNYSMGWYTCWNNAGETAQTSYGLPGINIISRNFNVSVWPNSKSPYVGTAPLNNVSFVVGMSDPLGPNNNYIQGCFQTELDCDGTGNYVNTGTKCSPNGETDVLNMYYNSDYTQAQGGGGEWVFPAFTDGSCNYPNPGVYYPELSGDGAGSTGPQYGRGTVILFPSKPLSVNVIATPNSGGTPFNNVDIHADAEGIMPATGEWGIVNLALRCNGNLGYEKEIAEGISPSNAVNPQTGQAWTDTQINDSYTIDFNGSNGAPLSSSLQHDFTCSYPSAGTYTPTVVVSQNGGTGAGGTSVYAIGQLDCSGNGAPLTAPTDYRLDWSAQNSVGCNAGTAVLKSYSGSNAAPATNWPTIEPASGSYTFYNVQAGDYEYTLSCLGNTPTSTVVSTCAVQVNPAP